MKTVRIPPDQPVQEPVTVEEAKAHLRIDYDAEDALIASYIAAVIVPMKPEGVEHRLGPALPSAAPGDRSYEAGRR